LSNNVTYRLARKADLPAMRLIQSRALRRLIAREGGDPSTMPITDEPSIEMRHLLNTDRELSWVASENGRPIGFSAGFVRGELWFLSDLFVLPEAQGKGVGAALLQRCLDGGLRRGARIRAVASSTDLGAQALYIRAGMVPRFPLFGIKGVSQGLRDLPPNKHRITRLTSSTKWIHQLAELDEAIWGRRRDCEHRFWLDESRMNCLAIADASGQLLGYAYYAPDRVGPLAASSTRIQLSLLRAIGDISGDASTGSTELRLPGINASALGALFGAGFRIDHMGVFMASRPFGRFERYVPSGGTLL
jgi:GNAT superfamily N-acetyltransferase